MATSLASRAADKPAPDYAEQILDEVRKRIAADQRVLDETRTRRKKVAKAADSFPGMLRTFGSGSLAHGTVNKPVSDGDAGGVIDRRTWPDYGPDGAKTPPKRLMRMVAEHIADKLQAEYPALTYELTKRAILFEFHQPLDGQDPSVDLVICLTRKGAPGFWIPNTEKQRWDASDPETHTKLMTARPADLRVSRARTVRLAKAAIKNDGDSAVLIPWNISALALQHIQTTGKPTEALAEFFEDMATSIERGLTPDPAEISPPIKLPDGIDQKRAARRLRFFASKMREAIENRHDHAKALAAMAEVFGEQLPEAPRSSKSSLAADLRNGNTSAAISSVFGPAKKTPRSFGG